MNALSENPIIILITILASIIAIIVFLTGKNSYKEVSDSLGKFVDRRMAVVFGTRTPFYMEYPLVYSKVSTSNYKVVNGDCIVYLQKTKEGFVIGQFQAFNYFVSDARKIADSFVQLLLKEGYEHNYSDTTKIDNVFFYVEEISKYIDNRGLGTIRFYSAEYKNLVLGFSLAWYGEKEKNELELMIDSFKFKA